MSKNCTLCITLLATLLLSCAKLPQKSGVQVSLWDTIPECYNNSDSLRAIYLYTEGVRVAAESGDRKKALPYFEKVLEIDSLHGPTHHQLAINFDESNPQKAYLHSQKALASDTTNIAYLSQYAYAQIGVNQIRAALQNYNRLIELDSKNPYYYQMAAAIYAAENMPHMAINILDSAEYKLGRIKELTAQKRALLMRVKLYDRAIEDALSEAANNPFDHTCHRVLGELYSITGQDSLAQASFDKAISLVPTDATTLWSLGDHFLSLKDMSSYLEVLSQIFALDEVPLEEKLNVYDKLVENIDLYRNNYFSINTLISTLYLKHSDTFEVVARYASHLIRGGDIDKALELYKRDIEKPNATEDAYIALVQITGYLGLREEMFAYLDEAIERFPNKTTFYLYKAYELQLDGVNTKREREIASLYKKAIKVAADNKEKSEVCGSLGDFYNAIGKNKECYSWYSNALEYNPDNSTVLNNWAYLMCEQKGADLDKALEMSVAACKLTPSNPTFLDTQGWILYLLGRTAEAKTIMRQAISLSGSGDPTLLLHYAEILEAEGEFFMAEIYYQRSLEAGGDENYISEKLATLKAKQN